MPPELAAEIGAALAPQLQRVGVFVNDDLSQIQRIIEQCSLDWVQLHGDEPAEWIRDLPAGQVIRAVRWDTAQVSPSTLCDQWDDSGAAALLVDAYSEGAYGGTGKVVDWSAVGELVQLSSLPVVLAGGLTPGNVRQGILKTRPAAVDTASGVETAPGVKSPDLVRRFVSEAKQAFTKNREI